MCGLWSQEEDCEMSPETGSARVGKGLASRAEGSILTAVGNQCGLSRRLGHPINLFERSLGLLCRDCTEEARVDTGSPVRR